MQWFCFSNYSLNYWNRRLHCGIFFPAMAVLVSRVWASGRFICLDWSMLLLVPQMSSSQGGSGAFSTAGNLQNWLHCDSKELLKQARRRARKFLFLFKHQSDKLGQQAWGHVLIRSRRLVNGLSVLFAKWQEKSQIALSHSDVEPLVETYIYYPQNLWCPI